MVVLAGSVHRFFHAVMDDPFRQWSDALVDEEAPKWEKCIRSWTSFCFAYRDVLEPL